MAKVRPNDPCPCGSGKKYKKCCGAAGDAGAANPEAILDAAFRYLNQGRFADAAKQAQKLVNGGIRHPDVFGVLGMAYYQLGKLGEAEQAMQQVTRLVPRSADAFANLGLVQFEGGKYQAAVASCGKALELDPSNAPAYNNLGNVFLKLGSYAEAEKNYRKALEFEPENALAQSNLGLALDKQGRHAEAVEVLESLVEWHPDFAGAHGRLGVARMGGGQMDAALDALTRAASLDPQNPEYPKLEGDYWALKGERERAEKAYRHALKLAPKFGDTLVGLAKLNVADGLAAQKYYAEALKVDPHNADALVHVGIGLLEQGQYSRATELLNRALEQDPASGMAHAGLGYAAVRQYQFDLAERECLRARELAPDEPYVIEAYTRLLSTQGKLDEAIAEWRRVLESDPDSLVAMMNLADMLSSNDDWESAAEMFRRAAELAPKDPAILTSWAALEEKRHHLDRAVELAQQAARLGGKEEATAWRVIARISRRQGRFEDALDAIGKAEALSGKWGDKFGLAATYFEKGQLFDKLKRFPEAFRAFEQANEMTIEAHGAAYDFSHDFSQARIEVFGRPEVQALEPLASDAPGAQPIFVVGFPRSGTTLMEQILGAHSQVVPAGELYLMGALVGDVGKQLLNASESYPKYLQTLAKADAQPALAVLRDYYLEGAHKIAGARNATWFVDKMPTNANHLGLIRLLFPRSPIVHMLRHPLDSCLSAFMSSFSQGHAYSNRIDTTATHFARSAKLALWYREHLDLNYLPVRYEDLVDDQEAKTREVLDFIGLPWEDNCMQFYKSKRVARTASYAQVTQKVYSSSRFRYRNYYGQLRPVFPIIEETVRAYGYTIAPPDSE